MCLKESQLGLLLYSEKKPFPSWCNVLCTCLVNYFRILTSFQLNVLNVVTKQFIDKNKNNAKETCLCVVVFVALSKENTVRTMPTHILHMTQGMV